MSAASRQQNSPPFTEQDTRFMDRALTLAARGRGRVEPNPMVGCVLVRNHRIIGEGYHHRFGGPHAEVEALRSCRGTARGATVYVTLEPCCHVGKTPPCTDALITAGVARVIAAMRDPFPRVKGRGFRLLRDAGIQVQSGLCEPQAIELNAPYLKRQRTGRPWVIAKWAQTIDGRIATRTGDSKWISDEPARRLVHRIRAGMDAILVGVNTVIADDPLLTCRGGKPQRIATRIVLDPHLRIPLDRQLFRTIEQAPVMVVTAMSQANTRKARTLTRTGVTLLPIGVKGQQLNLDSLLEELGSRGMTNILIEGGGQTLGLFHDARLIDEAYVFISRRLMGGHDAVDALGGAGPATMSEIRPAQWVKLTRCGADDLYHLRFNFRSLSGPAVLPS